MNPLDQPGQPFSFEAVNPKPSFRSTKEGPKYFLQLEIDKGSFDAFNDAKALRGSVLRIEATIEHAGEANLPRPYAHIASSLFRGGFFHYPPVREALGGETVDQRARTLAKELDHESISQVSPQEINAWCQVHSVPVRALPAEYRLPIKAAR